MKIYIIDNGDIFWGSAKQFDDCFGLNDTGNADPEIAQFCEFNNYTLKIQSVTPYVVCAANKNKNNGRIICGARHYDKIMRDQIYASEGRESWLGSEQGFIDNFGNFLTREEALVIANEQNQIRRPEAAPKTTKLFSEHLY